MLELKNVSKFYYNKGMVSAGFSRVNLKFDLGEFIAITGESGSGKSTLLNVISGLDSYEEGEMYINGEETSHYSEKDYEEYRKRYVGNIFQNFNLVNSYTVYQNIELVLLLNGKKKKDIKNKVIEIIKQVDLYKYRNRKVSKLSGGQKQRVAIGRVLAMNTPIILADEPTGNLDRKSSESVLKLLHDLSKDKLVIVVTHNYDQIEKYVTRKITMHDGKVINDQKIRDYEKVTESNVTDFSNIKLSNKIRLGVRNAFNIFSKFILIFAVYLFVLSFLFFSYSSFKQVEYEASTNGYNMFFGYDSDKRIIIRKNDKSSITDEDYKNIEKLSNVDYVVKNDLLVETSLVLSSDNYYLSGKVSNLSFINEVDYGDLPKKDDEVVIEMSKDNFYFKSLSKNKLNTEFVVENLTTFNKKYVVKIGGIICRDDYDNDYDVHFYVPSKFQDDLNKNLNRAASNVKYSFMGVDNTSYYQSYKYEILPSSKVSKGKVLIPEEYSYRCKDNNCKNESFKINISNMYFNKNVNYTVIGNTDKKNFTNLTGYNYENYNNCIFINDKDYDSLFSEEYFQSSVFVLNVKDVRKTIVELNDMGYKTLYLVDTLTTDNAFSYIIRIVMLCALTLLLIFLFFISYFIIRLILKSRNVYYSTLRILGSSSKATSDLLKIELLTISHTAFIVFTIYVLLNYFGVINLQNIKESCDYLTFGNYVIMYICLMVMTLLISNRYSRKLFKNSVMNTYREEV